MSSIKIANDFTSVDFNKPVKLRLGKEGVAALQPQTITDFFNEACQKYKEKPALAFTQEDNSAPWTFITYSEYLENVKQCARMLLHLGVESRSCVAILASNCPEWFYMELAAITIGAIAVGIYPTSSPEAVFHILHTAEASVCMIDTLEQLKKLEKIKHRLPKLKAIIQLKQSMEQPLNELSNVWQWSTLYNMKFDEQLNQIRIKREKEIYVNECALLIFTSGTVGLPKGVMLSHDNVIQECKAIRNILTEVKPGQESTISYLPLCHVAANVMDIFFITYIGGCTYFSDAQALRGTLFDTILKAKPTLFASVPRVFEKIQEKLESSQIDQSSYDIKASLGLENIKAFFIGTAPSDKQLKNYFLKLNMPIYEIYGLSESGGAVTLNKDYENFDSVGKPIPGIEMKIDKPNNQGEGEICCRGRTICMGYLKDPIKTQETIDNDGWLHTGDWGFLDNDGNLIVNGRIKELIITSGGENVPPTRIEALVKKELPCISNACVIGDQRKYLTILLTFKTQIDSTTGLPSDFLESDTINWLHMLGLNYNKLSDIFSENNTTILEALRHGLEKVNDQALSNVQKVKYFTVLPRDFSTATGELGDLLKVKRNVIIKKYAKLIDKMYEPGFANQFAKDIM